MQLYKMAVEYQQLLKEDEFSPEMLERLQSLDDDIKHKAIQLAAYVLNKEADKKAVQDAIQKMKNRLERIDVQILSLKHYLLTELTKCNIRAIEDHPEFEIKIKKNPPKVIINEADKVPEDFLIKKEEIHINKKAALESLKKGDTVPGLTLQQDERLDIT